MKIIRRSSCIFVPEAAEPVYTIVNPEFSPKSDIYR